VSLKSKKKKEREKKERRLELKGVPLPIESSVYRRLRGLFTISKPHPYPILYYLDIFTTPTLFIYIDPTVDTQVSDTEGKVWTILGWCPPGFCCLFLHYTTLYEMLRLGGVYSTHFLQRQAIFCHIKSSEM
jgi:hypothetical protein